MGGDLEEARGRNKRLRGEVAGLRSEAEAAGAAREEARACGALLEEGAREAAMRAEERFHALMAELNETEARLGEKGEENARLRSMIARLGGRIRALDALIEAKAEELVRMEGSRREADERKWGRGHWGGSRP